MPGETVTTATIVLEAFESSITMDLSGVLSSETPIASLVVDATAKYEVDLSGMRQIFTYQTDSLDVIDSSASDLFFFVNSSSEDSTGFAHEDMYVNVANSAMDASAIYMHPTEPTKNYVCHDFVRYLAKKLFNTHFGVDLFENELALLNDIRKLCDKEVDTDHVWRNIISVADAVNDASGSVYDDASGNICCQIFRQLVTQFPDRFADISNNLVPVAGEEGATAASKYYMPFKDGDVIQFKLTINAAEGQHTLTLADLEENEIAPRTYGISLVLKETLTDPSINVVDELEPYTDPTPV